MASSDADARAVRPPAAPHPSRIDVGRVVLGGLLAGLIINTGETVLNAFFLGAHYAEPMMAHGVAESPHSVAIFAVYGFLLGIVLIWLYAAMRPRFGPGPRTAAMAGLAVWFIYSGSFADFHLAVPVFPTAVPLGNLAWGFVELPLAAMAGAWVYREKEPAASAEPTSA
ncbi:MAG: hypothetical protein RH859_13165 [Longimicrobiales bacterium]